jgi:hypothetical protein
MTEQHPFKWRHFQADMILLCVRWYLRYSLSYRDLEEIMLERGLHVDHTTIYRLSCSAMHLNWRSEALPILMPPAIPGVSMKPPSRSKSSGCICIEPLMRRVGRSIFS